LYDLHVKYRLSPGQIFDFLDKLGERGYVETNDLRARLTPTGREWVLKNRIDIFGKVDRDSWRPMAQSPITGKVDPFAPYLPDLHLVNKAYFENFSQDGSVKQKG
jgi:DNA-binding PadR family transcriptional regulator